MKYMKEDKGNSAEAAVKIMISAEAQPKNEK